MFAATDLLEIDRRLKTCASEYRVALEGMDLERAGKAFVMINTLLDARLRALLPEGL